MSDLLVQCENVSLYLPGTADHSMILHNISWDIHEGEHSCLVGPNGSGKSTLLRLLAGELWVCEGRITWLGQNGERESSRLQGRAITSLVSPMSQRKLQRYGWHISGYELVLTGLEGTPLIYGEIDGSQSEKIYGLCEQLHCTELLERDIATLSQGQLRILLLARAFIRSPKLLLLDECTEGLDRAHRTTILEILEQMKEKTTMVFATHRIRHLPEFCTLHYAVSQGRLSRTQLSKLKETPKKKEHEKLLSPKGKAIFRLENATVFIDGTEILHNINWTVSQGEHWLLLGENGSGKSTLLRLLAGDLNCAWGGKVERWLPGSEEIVRELARMREKISLLSPHLESSYDYPVNAWELVLSGYENSIGLYREYSDAEKQRALVLIARFFPEEDLESLLTKPISLLSSGQMRRLFLARTLACRPDVLLMDEPCSGLDSEARERYLQLIEQIAHGKFFDKPVTIVYVSHNDSDIPTCINRSAIMEDGCLRILD